jgi:hypothetical protein
MDSFGILTGFWVLQKETVNLQANSRYHMKKILSERNIAGMLFILVMIVFSFAHEDSKKRNKHYIVSTPSVSADNTTAAITDKANISPATELSDSVSVK